MNCPECDKYMAVPSWKRCQDCDRKKRAEDKRQKKLKVKKAYLHGMSVREISGILKLSTHRIYQILGPVPKKHCKICGLPIPRKRVKYCSPYCLKDAQIMRYYKKKDEKNTRKA